MHSFAIVSISDTLSSIWIVQQTIEQAHIRNDFDCIDRFYTYFQHETILESRWEALSHEIVQTIDSPSPHWQNWYCRWRKWKTQPSYREAVLSALFFPQRYFIEYALYGNRNGNQSTAYSLAISASYQNSEARLYYTKNLEEKYRIQGNEKKIDKFYLLQGQILRDEVIGSMHEMGRELVAIAQLSGSVYGIPTNHTEAFKELESLASNSITALWNLTLYIKDKEKAKQNYLLLERQRMRSAILHFHLADHEEEEDLKRKLELLNKIPGEGALWYYTQSIDDYQRILNDFFSSGERGDAGSYFKAAELLLLSADPQNMRIADILKYLLIALENDIPLSEDRLKKFLCGCYHTILSESEQKKLIKQFKIAKAKGIQKRKMIQFKTKQLRILKKK